MDSVLPGRPGCTISFQTSPAVGARLAQALLILPAGAGTDAPVDNGLEHFFYVQKDSLTVKIGGRETALPPGGYVYVPAGTPFTLNSLCAKEARAVWVKRPYQSAPGVPAPGVILGHRDDARREDNGPRWRSFLLGNKALSMDFEMNIIWYAPGAHFWCIETHIMEHGMVMLQGDLRPGNPSIFG
jgi:(S)-ureidoglycine aminohydrolase